MGRAADRIFNPSSLKFAPINFGANFFLQKYKKTYIIFLVKDEQQIFSSLKIYQEGLAMPNNELSLDMFEILCSLDKFEEVTTLLMDKFQQTGNTECVNCVMLNDTVRTTVGRALTSLALVLPYIILEKVPSFDRLVFTHLDGKKLAAHLDRTILELFECNKQDLNDAVITTLHFLSQIAVNANGFIGTSISLCDIIEMSKDTKFKELMGWNIPSNLQFHEIENAITEKKAELTSFLQTADSEFGRLFRSGEAINTDQLCQAILSIGPKPDLFGRVVPETIDTSFLRGMRNPKDFFICAIGSRKALITNYKQVKNSGYMARKLLLLASGHKIDAETECCDTVHGVIVELKTAEHVRRILGKCVVFIDESDEETVLTEGHIETSIGKKVMMYSPITCNGKNGICKRCYGKLADLNLDIHAGCYGTLVISEQLTQKLLSSKHLLKTHSVKLDWPTEFTDHFMFDRSDIYADNEDIESIAIDEEDINQNEDGERVTNTVYVNITNKKPLKIVCPIDLLIDETVWADVECDENFLTLATNDKSKKRALFSFSVENIELSASLDAIFRLLEKEENTDIEKTYQSLLDMFIASSIDSPSVHFEIILRALVRSSSAKTERPDFSDPDAHAKCTILKLTGAILNSDAVTTSLAFERIKAQVADPDIFNKKAEGLFDCLFQF